jgi:arabinan endo-1,5-alpha-L-arabinosidase
VGRSPTPEGPSLDRDGKDLLGGGGSSFLATGGRRIGPGHAAILRKGDREWVSHHFYDGERRGAAALAVRELRWDDEGWPVAGKLLEAQGGAAAGGGGKAK